MSNSQAANKLVSWGSSISSSRRTGEGWKESQKKEHFRQQRLASFTSTTSGFAESLSGRCNAIADQLLEEEKELHDCNEILRDNKNQFQSREKELMDVLAEIRNTIPKKELSQNELLSVQEEAILHLKSTIARLQSEEEEQGNAVVVVADCVGCCQTAQANTSEAISELGKFLEKRVLPAAAELRTLVLSFPSPDAASVFSVKRLQMANQLSDTALDSGFIFSTVEDILRTLEVDLKDLRVWACQRVAAHCDRIEDCRTECENRALAVNDAHSAVALLKQTKNQLMLDLQSSATHLGTLEGQLVMFRKSIGENIEKAKLMEGKRTRLQRETQIQDHSLTESSTRAAELTRAISTAAHELVIVVDSVHKSDQRLEKHEVEAHELKFKIGTMQQEILTESQRCVELQEHVLSKEREYRQYSEKCTLLEIEKRNINEKDIEYSQTDSGLRAKIVVDNNSLLSADERLRATKTNIDLLKSQKSNIFREATELLSKNKGTSAEADAEEKTLHYLENEIRQVKESILASNLAAQKDTSQERFATAAGRTVPDLALTAPATELNHPRTFEVTRVENAVSTAPLQRLLLSENVAPWTVPLDIKQRGHTAPSTSTSSRIRAALDRL